MLEEIENLDNLNWKTFNGNEISEKLSNRIFSDIKKQLKKYPKNIFRFIVGCDSQRHCNKLTYSTTIIFQRIGFGGNCYCFKETESISSILKNPSKKIRFEKIKGLISIRLWKETYKSVHCAQWLNEVLSPLNLHVNEIHCDINANPLFKSNEQFKAITGYIEAFGFKPKTKPDAWGASGVANYQTK